jgi:moderate conductance mechanosensitive channel
MTSLPRRGHDYTMDQEGSDGASALLDGLLRSGEVLIAAGWQRFSRLAHVTEDLAALVNGPHALGVGPGTFTAAALVVAILSLLAFLAARSGLGRRRNGDLQSLWVPLAVALFGGTMVAIALSGGAAPLRRALLLIAFTVPIALLARALVTKIVLLQQSDGAPGALSGFAKWMGLTLGYGVIGIATGLILRAMQAGPGFRDIVATLFVALPVALIGIMAYAREGSSVAYALARGWSGSPRLQRLGLQWPRIAIGLIILAFLTQQVAITVAAPLPGLAFLLSLGAALLWPHLDVGLARWAAAGLGAQRVSLALLAMRRTARPALLIGVAAALIAVWGRPFVALTGLDIGGLVRISIGVAAIMLFSAFLWNLIGASVDRIAADDAPHGATADGEAHAPRSRLGTLLPLVGGTAKIAILALTALTVLLAVGVNVWPLVTGLSVFGLAIGFGSQTLVKDIVSGIFFLVDDAFRLGEYVETSGAKGTVEKISIRSVSLRHPRGALATIPYGQIGKIQNISRDWVIEKLAFRVAFDTDVDKVKKLFKQIGQDIADDPDLAPDLIEPFKSQGIGAVEDNTIVLRGKFKAKAGQQFAIRKAVLARVQRAFQENGIRMVPRPLTTQ